MVKLLYLIMCSLIFIRYDESLIFLLFFFIHSLFTVSHIAVFQIFYIIKYCIFQAFADLLGGVIPRLNPCDTDVEAYEVDGVQYLARVDSPY